MIRAIFIFIIASKFVIHSNIYPSKLSIISNIFIVIILQSYNLDNFKDDCQVDATFTDLKEATDTVDHGIFGLLVIPLFS